MCNLMSDLVICKFRKSMVIRVIECPQSDQVSLSNTNQTQYYIVLMSGAYTH